MLWVKYVSLNSWPYAILPPSWPESFQGRIEPPEPVRGHATHIDGIVLNVTNFIIQILCSLHCVIGRSTHTIEVLSAYTKCAHVEDRYQHFYGMGGLTRSTRTSILSNIQHYAVYVSTIGSCMPSRRLRLLDAPLVLPSLIASYKGSQEYIVIAIETCMIQRLYTV